MKAIKIAHLYPERMSIYGDFGNVLVLSQRMNWRGIKNEVVSIEVGDKLPKDIDMIFIGGGQDKGQVVVAEDLMAKSSQIKDFAESGGPLLSVCGGYQLLGEYFISSDYGQIQGIGLFNVISKATETRMIGNILVQSEKFGQLVGFENHSGATEFIGRAQPLGVVKKGFGNNPDDKLEGVIYKNAIGTYLHGSFLPKNPKVADWLIRQAIKYSGQNIKLKELNDELENSARKNAARKA
ncbi:MAG: glutamine amidotransferase [Candidatus Saccharibacteria bacterium]|jgi:CobQ-like glutamine amidotransferase family enzyme|nr:glutamine amidotransferase [Patescibacteria group bacterium]